MVVLFAIAIFASISFRFHAVSKGHHGARFWLLPILVFSVVYAVNFLANWIGVSLIKDDFLRESLPFFTSMAAILLECAIFAKLWKQVKALPDVR